MDTSLTVKGNWHRTSITDTAASGLVAQTIAGTHATFVLPIVPKPVRAASVPSRTPSGINTSKIDDYFGVTRPRATRESRHNSQVYLGLEIPPPYPNAMLPAYSASPNTEPVTLAMYLFKLGFLFPPFWMLGAVILTCPLTVPAEFEPSKSCTEREQLRRIIRNTELKWAKRCAWAFVVLLVLAGFVIATTIDVLRSLRS